MKVSELMPLLDAKLVKETFDRDLELTSGFGSDMMSDVLAFVRDDSLLLTGLNNLQVIRTAHMMDLQCILFVRGKVPSPEMIQLADNFGITVLYTEKTMFESCGLLFREGLLGGSSDHE